MAVQPIPEGDHTVTPYLTATDATALLAFIEKAFDATKRGGRWLGGSVAGWLSS